MLRGAIICIFLIFLLPGESLGQYALSGYVRDADSGELLIGANVVVKESGKGTASNAYGYYSLSLEAGNYLLLISSIGYDDLELSVELSSSQVLNIDMEEASYEIEEVTISTIRGSNDVSSTETGTIHLPIQLIRKIPAFMGEVDVIKTIQLLPGVHVPSEGSSGFSVRGGGRDQNLILLDEAPIYNASHLMGLFSVFNNDAIKDVQLYKGDIPVSSGGRLASLLDVRMREGNSKKFSMRGGLGTLSSRLTLEGPIVKDKLSFLLAGRRTYADLFLLLSGNETIRQTRLNFYDLNAKLSYQINHKNKLFLSAYTGKDSYNNKEYGGFFYGNRTLSLRWNHLFGSKLFSNFSVFNSRYFYDLGTVEDSPQYVNWKSDIADYGIKGDFTWYPAGGSTFKFGLSSIYHELEPGAITATSQGGINQSSDMPNDHALENGLYFSGESILGERLTLRYGLRYSVFMNLGPETVYIYDNAYQVSDSAFHGRGEIFNVDHGPEPRFAASYTLGEDQSIKASYARTRQYLQLATNATAGTPLEVWFPVSPNTKAQVSDQLTFGYFRNFLDKKLQTSIELYYKKMNHAIDFRDHAVLILNPALEGELRTGTATSAGTELHLRYDSRRLSGMLSYTLSRTMREIPEINGGDPYPAPYDKRHELSLVASYDLSRRISASATWVYSSGLPYTFPTGRMEVMGTVLPLYEGRNEYRLPDYHRLDLSLVIRGKHRPNRRWKGEWNFSVYNAYARKNLWALNFRQEADNPNVSYAEMTYLFSVVPSITYNFIF